MKCGAMPRLSLGPPVLVGIRGWEREPSVDSDHMRVRIFELRLLAAVLTALWTIAAGVVLLGYHPGGPIDLLVGLGAVTPIVIGSLGVIWPPAARGDRAFAAVAWIGLGACLLLIPSIGSILTQVLAGGPQTLLPSLEAVYPLFLALVATSLFSGLGVARRLLGGTALRRRRLELGALIALLCTVLSGSLFAGAAIANELAVRELPANASRFGPTSGGEPPQCRDPLGVPVTAQVEVSVTGDVDGQPIGSVELRGMRSGENVTWLADAITETHTGQYGLVNLDAVTWTRMPGGDWTEAPRSAANGQDIDRQALLTALTEGYRSAAEERGLEFVDGAPARHCRIALDGLTFEAAFPQASWMTAVQDLHRWRGQLDYWIFLDGYVGQIIASVNGEAASLERAGLQGNLRVTLTATDRDRPVSIVAPLP